MPGERLATLWLPEGYSNSHSHRYRCNIRYLDDFCRTEIGLVTVSYLVGRKRKEKRTNGDRPEVMRCKLIAVVISLDLESLVESCRGVLWVAIG